MSKRQKRENRIVKVVDKILQSPDFEFRKKETMNNHCKNLRDYVGMLLNEGAKRQALVNRLVKVVDKVRFQQRHFEDPLQRLYICNIPLRIRLVSGTAPHGCLSQIVLISCSASRNSEASISAVSSALPSIAETSTPRTIQLLTRVQSVKMLVETLSSFICRYRKFDLSNDETLILEYQDEKDEIIVLSVLATCVEGPNQEERLKHLFKLTCKYLAVVRLVCR